jgi:hypothetical protein
MILKTIFLILIGILVIGILTRVVIPLRQRSFLKNQGVVFCDYPILTEMQTLVKQVFEEPTMAVFPGLAEKLTRNADGTYPPCPD